MKPYLHAKVSAKKYGGVADDYVEIHNFIDSSKATYANVRHRAVLHSSFGIYLAEQVYGVHFTNSAGKEVSTRDIAEEHIIQDLGFIPTVEDWMGNITLQPWMSGIQKKHKRTVKMSLEQLID